MSSMLNISFLPVVLLFTALNLSACQTKAIKTQVSNSSTTVGISERTSTPHRIFQPIISKIRTRSKIPLSLPSYIPESDNPRLVAILETANSKEYKVMLAFYDSCNGGTACRLGSIAGDLVEKELKLDGKEITLANNITGYFTDANCAANCSDATLAWIDNNIRYIVAIKAGKQNTLVRMANSAIAYSLKNTRNTQDNSHTHNR